MAKTTLNVSGMSCGHCVQTVRQALEGVDGVEHVAVDLQAGRAVVEYDDARTSSDALAAAVSDEGYGAVPAPAG